MKTIGYKMILDEEGRETSQGQTYIVIDGSPAVLPEGFSDITSVINFINVGLILKKDYKWIRRQLQDFDWTSLSSEEKIWVAKYKAASEENCKSVLSSEDYIHWMTNFDLCSQECRNVRIANAKSILFANISLMDRYTILGFLNSVPTLMSNYTDQGIEGTSEGDPVEGVFNYVEATSGGAFEVYGIAALSLTMTGSLTKVEMIEKMMNCLRNGNY